MRISTSTTETRSSAAPRLDSSSSTTSADTSTGTSSSSRAYSLLDSTETEVLLSRKEAFCLAPTDAIDLTLPNADFAPGFTGIGTQCGGPSALWVREILPLGWGDTYFQGIAGQSFDVTDLPNGTYYIKVEANPGGFLHEQTADNNAEVREVIIKGRPGARRIEVPPWNGIDTESGLGGRGGGICCG